MGAESGVRSWKVSTVVSWALFMGREESGRRWLSAPQRLVLGRSHARAESHLRGVLNVAEEDGWGMKRLSM